MFRLVAERKEVCQEILRTLLDRPQLTVVRVTPQCVITSLHREIILDVLCILEDAKFPELSKAVRYFKETEGGFGEMCKTVEDHARNYAKDYAEEREKIGRSEGLAEGRSEAIRKMLQSGISREMILSMDYSETELEAVEKELLIQM